MASLKIICNNGFSVSGERSKSYVREGKSLQTYKCLHSSLLASCCNSVSSALLASHISYKSCHGTVCDGKIWSLISGNGRGKQAHLDTDRLLSRTPVWFPLSGFLSSCNSQHSFVLPNRKFKCGIIQNRGDQQTHLGKGKANGGKKRISFRLRPRLRLLYSRLRQVSAWSTLNDLQAFVRKNAKLLIISISVVVVLGLCSLFLKLTALPPPKIVPYSELVMSLQDGSVSKVLFEEGSRRIYYNINSQNVETTLKLEDKSSPVNGNVADSVESNGFGTPGRQAVGLSLLKKFMRTQKAPPQWQFSTRKIDHDEKFLLNMMRQRGTMYSSAPQSMLMSLRSILVTFLSLWVPLAPLMWLLYRQLSASNNPVKKRRPTGQSVSFDDVEGVDAAKVELMEIVLCLQGAINYEKLGAKLPRGVLLIGSPGTGKTLLARAVAGEAGVPFFTVSASEFVEMFVGRGAARIRDLFSVARKSAPSIIFIDELDAVGGKRGRSFNDERDQTLNQLLTEMDGFESDMKVVVIAATNRPEALDPALCRPGRFSRKVLVGEPNEEGRRKILAVHLRGVPLEEEAYIICDLVASLTQGLVGADLANIVNEAALLAARRGSETVTREDVMGAIERAKFGVNYLQPTTTTINKEMGKLFPWMSSLLGVGRDDRRQDGFQGPVGYQTLS